MLLFQCNPIFRFLQLFHGWGFKTHFRSHCIGLGERQAALERFGEGTRLHGPGYSALTSLDLTASFSHESTGVVHPEQIIRKRVGGFHTLAIAPGLWDRRLWNSCRCCWFWMVHYLCVFEDWGGMSARFLLGVANVTEQADPSLIIVRRRSVKRHGLYLMMLQKAQASLVTV